MLKEKNLRKQKKAYESSKFQRLKNTIFRGKLWADKQPLTDYEIQAATLSQ